MKSKSSRFTRRIVLMPLLGLIILLGLPALVSAGSSSAKEALQTAWERAAANGRYSYQADVLQTIHPTASLENVGRSPQVQYLTVKGNMDVRQETMQLEMQSGEHAPLAVKIEDGVTYGFDPATEEWSELEGVTDAFAPGGDPLGYLTAVENVHLMDALAESAFPVNDLLPPDYTQSATRYTFDINGPQYAQFMRDQMEKQLREQGNLPSGMRLETAQIYNEMQGYGEIWLDEAGLPLRQMIHLEFPPQENTSEWVEAQITTEFRDWQAGPIGVFNQLQQNPQLLLSDPLGTFGISPQGAQQAGLNLMFGLAAFAFVALLITHRRSRLLYAGLAVGIIASMLLTPLLQGQQVHAFVASQQTKQTASTHQQFAQTEQAQVEAAFNGSAFNPSLNPLANTAVSPALQAPITPPACDLPEDIDCDGNEDNDGDGLTDRVEKRELGTDPDSADTDGDLISDKAEVVGYFGNGRQWYLNPLHPDSNGDGFVDTMECPDLVNLNISGAFIAPSGTACADTDSDGVADIFDQDNDGDGVPDRQDSSPNYLDDLTRVAQDQIALTLDGYDTTTTRPVVVTFELRPEVYEHLYQTNNVLDWPDNDDRGQVMRVNDNTFADLGYSGSQMAQGDMMLVPMLEIAMPAPASNNSNPSSGLPVLSSFAGSFATAPLSDWLDTAVLDEYGITVSQDEDTGELYAYLPLTVIEDAHGGAPLAWGGQMRYQSLSGSFGLAHQVQLVWQVQALNDHCDTSGMSGNDKYDEWCATDGGHWVTETAVIHAYYEPFHLTGFTVQEDYGFDIAVMGQADALSVPYDDDLWHLGNSLMSTFGEGQLIDDDGVTGGDRRFDIDEIETRFGAGSGTEWDIDLSNLHVTTNSYADQPTGLRGMIETDIPDMLANNYTATAVSGDDVTLLIAREEAFKALSLAQIDPAAIVDDGSGNLTLNVSLAAQSTQTYATLNWTPYEYDGTDWSGADIFAQLDRLRTNLDSAVSDDDVLEMMSWFGAAPTAIAAARIGIIGVARNFYLALYNGHSQVVADSTAVFLNDTVVDDSFYSKDFDSDGQVDKSLLIYVATAVGLLQTFFQREEEPLLDEFNEVLEVIGYLEIENSEEYDTTAVLINSIGKGAKGGLKKAIKMFYKVQGSRKYYPQRTYVSAAISVAGLTSAAMGLYIGITGDANKDLILAMDSLTLASETLGAIDAVYSLYSVAQGGYETARQAMATLTKLEQSTKMAAGIGLAFDIAIATTFFALSVRNLDPGSFAFNALLALYIAQLILAVITFIIASTVIGAVILAVIGLIDTIIGFICDYNDANESEDVQKWVCGGLTGIVTQLIVYAIYDMALVADLEAKNRLDFALEVPVFNRGPSSTQDGIIAGNTVTLSTDVTNTLKMGSVTGLGSAYAAVTGQFFTNQNLKRSVFTYTLQDNDDDVHYGSIEFGDLTWPDNQEAFTASHTFTLTQAGLNQPPGAVFLDESFKIPAMECWGLVLQYCYERVFRDAIPYDLTGQFLFDVFPSTFAEFVTMTDAGNGSYRMAWSGDDFPVLQDADGDGLVSQAKGGGDPNDNLPDSDGDGLSDFWEYENGTDLLNGDSDNDGLTDYWETVYLTNPNLADSDGDGLLDGEELFHADNLYPYENNPQYVGGATWSGGWEIVYDYANDGTPLRTLVTADPHDADVDGDFINDAKERVYGYNPVVAEEINILNLDTAVSSDAVAVGSSLSYTATVQNELDNRIINGLLQAEFPVDSVQSTAVIDTLSPQQAITMTGSVVAPDISASTTTSLTLRAGAIIEDPNTGRVLWLHLNESGSATSFEDDAQTSGGPHNATCSGSACPGTGNGSLNFDGNDLLTVPAHSELDPDAFTLSMWVRRDNTSGIQTYLAKGSNGFAVGTDGNPVQATVYLADCVTPVTVSGGLLPTLNWQHVVVTYDGTTLTLYYNGVARDSATAVSLCHNSDDITIGSGFQGKMDEVEIYPRAMTAVEIASLYNKPVFYLPNYTSPPSLVYFAQDASEYSQSVLSCGVFSTDDTVCPLESSAVIGDGFAFDERHAFTVAGNPILQLGSNDNTFAMSLWINPDNNYTPNNQHLTDWGQLILGNDANGYEKAYPSLYQKGQQVMIRFGHANGLGYCEATSSNVLAYDQWQFITLSFDGSNFHLYKNGALADSFAGLNCANQDLYPEDDFFIGHGKSPAIYFTSFDEIKHANNGEGFIWSEENDYNNGVGSLPLVWNSPAGVMDKDATVTINAWAKTFGEDISFMFCNRDDPEDGIPASCSGDNQALLFGTQNDASTWEWITTHSFYESLGTNSLRYNLDGNKYKGTLHYNVYATGFQGALDEIRLYRGGLTDEEAAELYASSIRTLELSFDEPPGQDIFADATSNGFDAICSGATCPDSGIPARSNQSVRFDGVDDQLTLPNADTLGLTNNSFTVMAWVKGSAFSGDRAILGTDGGVGDRADLFLGTRDGKPYMSFGGVGNEVTGATTLQPDQWYHLAFRYNAGGQHQTIYLNGGDVGDAWSGEGARASFVGTGAVRVGTAVSGSTFAGQIDHLVIVKRSLTFTEIQAAMNESPILNLHLDEDFNTSAFVDDTPFANDATCTACPAAGAKGQMREAAVFAGSQVLTIANADEIDALSNQFSIMAWIKPADVVGHHRIVAHGRATSNNGFGFGVNDGGLAFTTWGIQGYFSTASIVPNYWQHVAVVFDENNDAHFYLNGTFVDTITGSAPVTLNTDNDPLTIGGTTPIGASGLMETFAGQIDELAIYGTPLSAARIRAIFDYQNAWYDTKTEHPVLIDADDPVVTLDVYSTLPLADTFLSLRAIDDTTYVDNVSVTITAPDSSITTQQATASGKAWIIAFNPTMAGDYLFDVTATDAVGNQGTVSGQVVTVDSSAPTLAITAVPIQQAITTTTFSGTANDDHSLSGNPILLNLIDHNGLSVSGGQNAPLSGTSWSGDYPFTVPPYGSYQLTASGADSAGNLGSVSATVQLDGYAPFGGLYAPNGVITQTGQIVAGLLSDDMYPQQGKILHLPFETANGAQPLLDVSPSGFTAVCPTCPTTGSSGSGSGEAAFFDGTDDSLMIAANPLLNVADITLMAWVAPAWTPGSLGYNPTVAALADGSATAYRLQIADDQQSVILANDTGSQTIFVPLTTARADGLWHHLAVTSEGDVWTAYLDGVALGTITQTLTITPDLPLQIGTADGTSDLYQGYLDEVVLYDQALSKEALYNIAHPIATGVGEAQVRFRSLADGDLAAADGTWYTAVTSVTQNVGLWQLPVPDGLEGLYKIDISGTDSVGNSGFTPNAWSGEIDNLAPRLSLVYTPSADYQTAQVSCAAEDFNLVESGWACPVDDAFRTAGYEDATWFTDVFTDVQKLTSLTTSEQTVPITPGTPTLTACDLFGHCATVTAGLDILAVAAPPASVQVGEVLTVETTVFSGYDADKSYTITWYWGDGTTSAGTINAAGPATISGSHSYTASATPSVYVEVHDNADNSLVAFSLPFDLIVNIKPTAVPDTTTTDEDTAVTIDVLANDIDPDSVDLTINSVTQPENGIVVNNGSDVSYTPNANFFGSDAFSYEVCDGGGLCDTGDVTVTVNSVNDVPEVGPITAPLVPVQIGTSIEATAVYSDADELESLTAVWEWGDGSITSQDLSGTNGTATANHTYTVPDVYIVTLTITDTAGDTATSVFEYIVVFDPSVGATNGVGWFYAPPDSYYDGDPALSETGRIGFLARYRRDLPEPVGNFNFTIHPLGSRLNGLGYDWLVINGNEATFQGYGDMDGSGDYGFLVSVIDNGEQNDLVRVRIWNRVTGQLLYDTDPNSALNDPATVPLSGGSITIYLY